MRNFAIDGILAGAVAGRKVLGALVEKVATEPTSPETLYLDFDGVELATASFLRECVIGFRDIVRSQSSNYYPVVANANAVVIEELSVVLGQSGDALLQCDLDGSDKPNFRRVIGNLEPKQKITFDLVKKLGETDASNLMTASGDNEQVGQTAWNNRLASLVRLGLLVELSSGRAKRYRAVLGEK